MSVLLHTNDTIIGTRVYPIKVGYYILSIQEQRVTKYYTSK